MRRNSFRRRGPVFAVAVAAVAVAGLLAVPTASAASGGPSPLAASAAPTVKTNDVFIRDNAADNGNEPTNQLPVWESPDIWVCNTAAACGGVDPVIGQTNFVNVRLNNVGQFSVAGNIDVYYTAAGGNAQWPADWVTIGVAGNVAVPPGGLTVQIPWASVPGPGHFCLLARFVSTIDPMTFPETNDTEQNTINNNNIAWHNVDTVRLGAGQSTKLPFTLADTAAQVEKTKLVFANPDGAFSATGGTLTIDLGQELAAQWKAAGEPGIGVSQLNGTTVQILDPRNAQIQGLTVPPKERLGTTLTFAAKGNVKSVVTVDEQDNGSGQDLGGVEYVLTSG
jgi:hypothetical protein